MLDIRRTERFNVAYRRGSDLSRCRSQTGRISDILVKGQQHFFRKPMTFKRLFLCILLALPFLGMIIASPCPSCDSPYSVYMTEYNRRPDEDKVQQKMIEYWSRPEVFNSLPPGMKDKVGTYIRQYPEYQYKSSDSPSERASTKRKGDPCRIG